MCTGFCSNRSLHSLRQIPKSATAGVCGNSTFSFILTATLCFRVAVLFYILLKNFEQRCDPVYDLKPLSGGRVKHVCRESKGRGKEISGGPGETRGCQHVVGEVQLVRRNQIRGMCGS